MIGGTILFDHVANIEPHDLSSEIMGAFADWTGLERIPRGGAAIEVGSSSTFEDGL